MLMLLKYKLIRYIQLTTMTLIFGAKMKKPHGFAVSTWSKTQIFINLSCCSGNSHFQRANTQRALPPAQHRIAVTQFPYCKGWEPPRESSTCSTALARGKPPQGHYKSWGIPRRKLLRGCRLGQGCREELLPCGCPGSLCSRRSPAGPPYQSQQLTDPKQS